MLLQLVLHSNAVCFWLGGASGSIFMPSALLNV
jgi:hypothetical protein